MNTVPQSNPKAGYDAHAGEINEAVRRVLASGWYILGKEVESFEKEFAMFHGFEESVGVGNGTDALELALRAIGVRSGDLVFTVSHTAVATVSAIERSGGVPVLVDIDAGSFTIDPQCLEEAIIHQKSLGKGTPRAIVVVHLYGHPAAIPEIFSIAKAHGLTIVEDCSQAHGAKLDDKLVGTFGTAAAFSFYPTKNLGALGDGGAVLARDPMIMERVRLLREYGWKSRYISHEPGWNTRLDELQAAILRVKLKALADENKKRRAIAANYVEKLQETTVSVPTVSRGVEHAFHQFVVRAANRENLRRHLATKGIGTLVHYPVPIHLQPAYAGRCAMYPRGLPQTLRAASEVVSLPMFPQLKREEIDLVAQTILQHSKSLQN